MNQSLYFPRLSGMKPALKYGISAIVVVVLLVAAGAYLLFGGDSPDEVDLDTAVGAVSTTTGSDDSSGGSGTETDIAGTWSIDSETGEFDFESATGTFVGFRIDEELVNVGATEAVGRTGDVTGTLVIDGDTVGSVDVTADMTTITTNNSRRNSRVQEALDTDQFPEATFSLTEGIVLPDGAASGEKVSVTGVGELTVHGVTQQIEIPLEAQLAGDTIVIVGSTEITFADFDVEVPSAPVVLSVSDTGTLELQLLLKRS